MNPAVAAWVRRHLTIRTCVRTVAGISALMIIFAAYVYDRTVEHPPEPPICGTALPYDPFAAQWFRVADKTGSLIARLMNEPLPSDATFARYFFGTFDVLKWWGITLLNPIRGAEHFAGIPEGGGAGVNPYTVAQPCIPPTEACTEPPAPGAPPVAPEPQWDPKNAALGTGQKLTGIHAVAQAASKYWTGTNLQIAVAIAGAESTYRPITGPTVGRGTMRGYWQINDGAHPQLFAHGADWRDPAVNAAMAFDVYKRAGNSWSPWSTYNSGGYRKHMAEAASALGQAAPVVTAISNSPAKPPAQPTPPSGTIPLDPMTGSVAAPVQPPAQQTPPAQCVPAAPSTGGGGPDTVGIWNIWYRNSAANVNSAAGFADLVCLNELRSQRVNVPGYQMTPYSSAVEIISRTSKLDRLEVHRTTTLTGYARDKSAVWGVWRSRTTGKQFAAICTHQLVQGGSGWSKQATNVNQIRAALTRRGIPVIVLGDMNAQAGKVAAAFGGSHDCVRIICMIGHGIQPSHTETLSKMGSDHSRVRFTFPQTAAKAPPATPPAAGVRTVTSKGRTYQIPIPAGPEGVAINYALDQLGKPYVWAAHGPNAFDCSGLVSAAYRKAGYSVFPQTEVMAAQEPRATGEDRPGDLWGHFGHVQMYLGVIDGKPTVVEAANPRDDIRIDQSGWMNVKWKLRPTGAK